MSNKRELISEQIQDLLKQINLSVSHVLSTVIDDSPVTAHQMYILKKIRMNPRINLSALCKKLSLSKGAMSLAVNKLVEEGYVLRYDNNKDRRNIDLMLTDNGEKILDDTVQKCRNVFTKLTNTIKEDELKLIKESLDTLNTSIHSVISMELKQEDKIN